MIRSLLTPTSTDLHISIPKEYVGKKVELLLFTTGEATATKGRKSATLGKYLGILSPKEAGQFNNEIRKSRGEWEKNS